MTAALRSDDLIGVRLAPLPPYPAVSRAGADRPLSPALIPALLLVDYLAATAARAGADAGADAVERHSGCAEHPEHAACLRCAVFGATPMRTLAEALLDMLSVRDLDSDWNQLPSTTSGRVAGRLRKTLIDERDLETLYGPHWAQVLIACLRVESADLLQLEQLSAGGGDRLLIGRIIGDPAATRAALAAYHLACRVCPQAGDPAERARHNPTARRVAVAVAYLALGHPISWLDQLPAPAL